MGFLISFVISFVVAFFVVSLLLSGERRHRAPFVFSLPVLGYGLCYLLLGAVLFLAVTRVTR